MNIPQLVAFFSVTALRVSSECPSPVGLEITDLQSDKVSFRWDSNTFMTHVDHCVCIEHGGSVDELCQEDARFPSSCSHRDEHWSSFQLEAYTNYTVCVQRHCIPQLSPPSCVSFTTAPVAPGTPNELYADSDTPWSLVAHWQYPLSKNGPLDGYEVHWCLAPDCSVTSSHRVKGADNRRHRITGLTPYTTYEVRVFAYNFDRGRYLYSGYKSTRQTTLPTYPSKPSLTWWNSSPHAVKVKIQRPKDPNGPIDGFHLVSCATLHCEQTKIEYTFSDSNPGVETIKNLQPWKEYTLTLTAFNKQSHNRKLYSEPANFTVFTMPKALSEPPEVRATPQSTQVMVEWEYPLNTSMEPRNYRVSWCTLDYSRCYYTFKDTERHIVVEGLQPAATYIFSVRALLLFNACYVPGEISFLRVTTLPGDPSRPERVRITWKNATSVQVAWEKPLDPQGEVDGYRFRACAEEFCSASHKFTVRRGQSSEATVSGLVPYTEYYFYVAAFNLLPNGDMMHGDIAEIAFTTNATSPDKPRTLHAIGDTPFSIFVSWSHPNQTNGPLLWYNVLWREASPKDGDLVERSSILTKDINYTITGLHPFTTYAVGVFRINEVEGSTWPGAPAETEGSTKPLPFPPVRDLVASADASNEAYAAALSWTEPEVTSHPKIEGYMITICQEDKSECQNETTKQNRHRVVLGKADGRVKYDIIVQAYVTLHGLPVTGIPANVSIAVRPPLVEPMLLNITHFDCCTANVSWIRPRLSDEYHLYYLVKTSPGKQEVTRDADHTWESLNGLRPGTNYTVSVRPCVDLDGGKDCGLWNSATFKTHPTPPGQPRNVNVTKSTNHYQVSWMPPLDANGPLDGYEVSWYNPPGAEFPSGKLHTTDGPLGPVVLPGLKEGVPCALTIAAFNDYRGKRLMGAPLNVTFLP